MIQYSIVFRQSRSEHFDLVQHGVPAEILSTVARDMGIGDKEILDILQLRKASVRRKLAAHRPLYRDEASRVVGLLRLIGQVEVMVAASGDSTEFSAAKWLASWLRIPNSALGGRLPADFMCLSEGRELLSDLLRQIQSGSYA